jgi:hypothetical protein
MSVTITGLTQGAINTAYAFTATVRPVTATAPITYTWAPPPGSGQGSANARYTWATTGTKTITVTAANAAGSAVDTHTVVMRAPVQGVVISGPTAGVVNTAYAFTATVSPVTATTPITYTWVPTPGSGQGTVTVVYSWTIVGTKTIAVTATNVAGWAVDTHTVVVKASVYLPIIRRSP